MRLEESNQARRMRQQEPLLFWLGWVGGIALSCKLHAVRMQSASCFLYLIRSSSVRKQHCARLQLVDREKLPTDCGKTSHG
jgi:hypothetical protein